MKPRTSIIVGAMFAFLGVTLGALATHGLSLDDYSRGVFETGVRYQLYHALALMIVGILGLLKTRWKVTRASWFFIAGMIIFSGSLYGLALTGEKVLGAVTPFGGLCFLIGWIVFIRQVSAPSV